MRTHTWIVLLVLLVITSSLITFAFNNKKSTQETNMKPRFTVLTLGVDNLERTLKFYHDGLGFPTKGIIGKEFEHGTVIFIDLPHGMKLAFYSRADLAWDAKIAKEAPGATELSIGYTVNNKKEVDAIMALAKKAGAKITKPAQDAFWGGYSGYFQDPDGHLWEIAWNPQLLPED
jgi:catechol 2,3-dioxygenase-like lactoylglutathione lyase family enzyme